MEVHGDSTAKFAELRSVFEQNFAKRGELGASLCVWHEGKKVADLWGGLYTSVNDMDAGEVPLVIVHGTADPTVPFSQAEALRDRAEL